MGVAAGKLKDTDGAIAKYDELITKYRDSAVPTIQYQVGQALFNKGATLGQTGIPKSAVYMILSRFGENPFPDIQELVATVMFNKAAYIVAQNEAIKPMTRCSPVPHE